MCRIANLFFLQRLKGRMSGDARDFNNKEKRGEVNFSPSRQDAEENSSILSETLGDHTPMYATGKNCVAHFKRGDFSSCSAHRPVRPKTMTKPENNEQIHELNLGRLPDLG